ncbi:MAG: hypothetical protein K1X78_23030 [Verrucomicrobiaceae bacterium]|nr:hypothetical protein [Verrucomicrobiaceae bacterium]
MATSSRPSVDQLKRALQISEQIQKLETEMASILGSSAVSSGSSKPGPVKRKKSKISAEGLANIIAAQKRRWAKVKKEKAKAVKPD